MLRSLIPCSLLLFLCQTAAAGTFIPVSGEQYATKKVHKIVVNGKDGKANIDAVFTDGTIKNYPFSNSGRIYFDSFHKSDAVPACGNGVYLYPNPVSSRLTVCGLAPGQRVSVYSSMGTVVASAVAGGPVLEIDVENLRGGVYFVRTQNCALKFVKQ